MKTTTKSTIKEWFTIMSIAFIIGMLVHFGINTAKIVWPTPPVEFKVSLDEN